MTGESIHDEAAPPSPPTTPPVRQSLRRNFLANVISHVAINAANFLINLALVRYVGQTLHGQYVLVWSISAVAVLLSTAGLVGSLGVQRLAVAVDRDIDAANRHISGFAGTSILIALALGTAMFALAEPIARWQGEPIAELVRLAAIWPLARVLLRVTGMVGVGLEASTVNATNMTMFHGARLAWLGAAITLGLSLTGVFIGWAIVMPAAGLLCLLTIRPLMRRRGLRLRPAFVGPGKFIALLSQSLPYLVANAATMLMPAMLQMLIGARLPDAASVSYFQVAYSLSVTMLLLAYPAATTVLPTVSRLHASPDPEDRQRVRTLIRRSYAKLATVGLLVIAATAWAGQWAMTVLFKPAYGQYIDLLVALTVAAAITSLRIMLDRFLFAGGRPRGVAWLEAGRYAVVLMLGSWLLPTHGMMALAWVLVASDAASLLLRIGLIRKAMDVRLATATIGWLLAAAGIWAAFAAAGPWAALIAGTVAGPVLAWVGRRPAIV